jgi:hypothetical protein
VALLSAVFEFVGCTIKIVARLFYIMPLLVLGAPSNAAGFSGEQLNALAVLLLNVNDRGAAVALPFFGFSTLLQGWLIVRSTFLPRWLGVLTILGGAGWLAFLWQPLETAFSPLSRCSVSSAPSRRSSGCWCVRWTSRAGSSKCAHPRHQHGGNADDGREPSRYIHGHGASEGHQADPSRLRRSG